jgi:methylenetetrahydrofolate reductase (NADPH)
LSGLADALTRPRFEVYAAAGVASAIARHVPTSIKITITSSEARGLDATLDLAEEVASLGHEVVPHLAARLVLDRSHLGRILERLEAAGVDEVFVIAGDAKEPLGDFPDAISLLHAMDELGHSLTDIGFVGYPEPHPFLSEEVLARALADKARSATYIVTQICFRAEPIDAWVAGLRRDGIALPVYVGIPGVVDRQRLRRVLTRLGLDGATPTPGSASGEAYLPDALVDGLSSLDDPGAGIGGFHVYTFNELAETERWRRAKLAQAAVTQETLT